MRRHPRPSSDAVDSTASRGAFDVQRPGIGGARAKSRRWCGPAPPGVQLYGRVHAWKEDNKQRYEEELRQREQEALQACTFAPSVNHSSPRPHAAEPSIPVKPASRPGTPGKATAGKQLAAGSTADALDFRVFTQQQAALEAGRQQAETPSSGNAAALGSSQPAAEALQLQTAESISSDKASSLRTGGSNIITIAADATAAAGAPAPHGQGEVFGRLYEAGQASLRRKEAYAKAAVAAERAGLLSASPHPLPLPAGLPSTGASRPASPAGRTVMEGFLGEAACTFQPKTNLHLKPRSRPGTPKKTPPVQPPESPVRATDAPTPQAIPVEQALIPAVTPGLPGALSAAEPAAAADPGHLIGSADSGSMSAAVEAAHEEAASALARLAYIEARQVLASGRSADMGSGIVAHGVSGRLDWNEFMARQTSFLQAKEQHAEAARAEALPVGRPELCPTSRKLLEHIQGRSTIAAGRTTSAPPVQNLQEFAAAPPSSASFLGHEQETFRPKISRDAHARPGRTVQEMSSGDALRHELLVEHARHEAVQRQLQELTFKPVINRSRDVGPVISMLDPGRHLAQVAATQIRREAERVQRQMQKEEEELRACTFKPNTKKLPAYISRMAASHRARKQGSTAQHNRTSF